MIFMRFIELTQIVGNEVIGEQEQKRWFNAENINNILKRGNYTILFMMTNSTGFKIKESPEQIMEIISKAKEI